MGFPLAALLAALAAGVPASVPVARPLRPAAYEAAASRILSALESPDARLLAAEVDPLVVGPAARGYTRPEAALLQSVSTVQTKIEVPGSESVLVAVRDFIEPHVAQACALASPFAGWLRDARPDLVAAVEFACSFIDDPGGLAAERMRRLDHFAALVASPAASRLERAMRADQSRASLALEDAGASQAIIAVAAKVVGWPDVMLPVHRILGFPTVGFYADTGVFRSSRRPATRRMADLDSAAHNRRLATTLAHGWRVASEARRAELRVVSQKTYEEVGKGLMFGPFEEDDLDGLFGRGEWHALNRFGVTQGFEPDGVTPSVRPCDNARASLTNECLETEEALACESASFPALVASLFHDLAPEGRCPSLLHSTDDVVKAYRRMAAADAGTTVVALYDHVQGGPRFFVMPGHNFGLVSAVLSWNRESQMVAALARRLFGVPCCAYFDDYDVCEPSWAAPSGKLVLRRLHELLGIPLADNHKDIPPRAINAFLGVITDLSRSASGAAVMRSKPERVAKLCLAAERYLREGGPQGDELKTFLGKCEYLHASAVAGKLGRAAVGMLRRWDVARRASKRRPGGGGSADDGTDWDELARQALTFLLKVLPRLPPRVFRFRRGRKGPKPIILYTDAMYEEKAAVPAKIGVAQYDAERSRKWRHLEAAVPRWLFAHWRVRQQYITVLEVLAPLVAFLSDPEAYRGRDVILFIDNSGALFGIGKGDCRDADCARLILILHAACAALRVRLWVEHVATGANLADMPSRGDCSLLLRWGSEEIPEDRVVWPDVASTLDVAFDGVWAALAGPETAAEAASRAEIEDAIARQRAALPRRRCGAARKRARERWRAQG